MAANELSEFAKRDVNCSAQVLLGDFNSPPDTLPYQLLSCGRISDIISTIHPNCDATLDVSSS
jgi:endonuclease/exonuclease/phosphatase family metal-dependent hydrolase